MGGREDRKRWIEARTCRKPIREVNEGMSELILNKQSVKDWTGFN
jgi:hypothetical protein